MALASWETTYLHSWAQKPLIQTINPWNFRQDIDVKNSPRLKAVKKIKNVMEAHSVYGVYDIVAKVEAEDMGKLKDVVTWNVRRLNNVRSTLTMIVMEESS